MNKPTSEMGQIIAPFLHKKIGVRLSTKYMIWGEVLSLHEDGIRMLDKMGQTHYVAYKIIVEVSDTYNETKVTGGE